MKTLEIKLPEPTLEKFQAAAEKLGVTVDQLLESAIAEKLERLDYLFLDASRYALEKNKELYKRLA